VEWFKEKIIVETRGKGLYPITQLLTPILKSWSIQEGICYLFIPHTSASLVINESYDPSARQDMEAFMENLAPEGEPWYRHTLEGRDDSPSHMRAILTATTFSSQICFDPLSESGLKGEY